MRNDHVVLDFVKEPIPQKIETGHNVEGLMRQNPIFAKSDVPIDDLKMCNDLLQSRYVASISGGKEETALLHQAEEVWIDKMRKTAKYVDRVADGDGAVILSAGFNLAKQRSPSTRPEFSVELGEKSGSVLLRRQRVEGARSYIWQYYIGETPTNDADWVTAQVTSQASVELTGLKPLTQYWFRVAAVTIQGTTAFCSPIMQVVI
jgi:hypothetical protein